MAHYFLKNGVSFIKISNPPVNGFSLAVRDGVLRLLDQARSDRSNSLVLFGEGKNFSAGADIAEFSLGKHMMKPGLTEVIASLDEFDKPLVACINGVALGGGLEVALSCHWRMASPTASVGLPEVHLGILPGFSLAVRDGVLRLLDQARSDRSNSLVLFGEGKNFSAGADIAEFSLGKHMMKPGLTEVIASLDEFDKPLVACINGVALGGGLEVALSCHWRMASPTASVGLPEVHLGILPGAGGTQRLPRLIGVEKALELMVSGRSLRANEALKLGIIDEVASSPFASEDDLVARAITFASSEKVQGADVKARRISGRTVPGEYSEDALDTVEKNVASAARGFKAPLNIAKAARAAVTLPFDKGMMRERELFEELSSGSQAPAMQYMFFSERAVSSPPALPDGSCVPQISSVGVIGGGTMGAGISMCFANAGIPVTLVETSKEASQAAVDRITRTYKSSSAYRSGKMTDEGINKLLSLITPVHDMGDLRNSDLVIEAVYENMVTKKDIFTKLDKICKPGAVLASNTSYLSIDEIAGVTTRPNQVIGTHFFSPANVMKLLEIVKGEETSREVIAACMHIAKKIQKQPVLAGNCFGFIGNRMLEFYGKEANFLVEEGASPSQIDGVLKSRIGMAMGFFEMCDLAGNDVGWRLRKGMNLVGDNASGRDPSKRYSALGDQLCDREWFGQKTGKGWYLYDPSAPRKPVENADVQKLIEEHRKSIGIPPREISDSEIIERTLYALVNEGFRILEEGIAQGPPDIDVVYVYGYGFPRYRGGPMWWAEREVGLDKVLKSLEQYAIKFPQQPHLKPAQLLVDVVSSGKSIKQVLAARKTN